MTSSADSDNQTFSDAVLGLERGDFTLLDPLLEQNLTSGECPIITWYNEGRFANEPKALNGALTCACFNGRTMVAEFLLTKGVDPSAGNGTGLNAFHWAANRGQLETVKLLIERKAPLEVESMYGGTVLGTAIWSAVNEPKPDHLAIIEALIQAGANLDAAEYPTGNAQVDELLRRHGRKVDESR